MKVRTFTLIPIVSLIVLSVVAIGFLLSSNNAFDKLANSYNRGYSLLL